VVFAEHLTHGCVIHGCDIISGQVANDKFTTPYLYLSKYDARAMFWVFLTNYGSRFDKAKCIGSRQAALTEVGLD
jgi:hypothetical protein